MYLMMMMKQTEERGISYLYCLLFLHLSPRHMDLSLSLPFFKMFKLSYIRQGSSHLASFVVTKAACQMCGGPPVVRDAPSLTAQKSAKPLCVNCSNDEKEVWDFLDYLKHSTNIQVLLMNMQQWFGMMMMMRGSYKQNLQF